MTRLGVLGGSFDPVHLGHLWIATFALEQLSLDRVLFVPAAVPPHKEGGTVAPYTFRLDLLRRAVAPHAGLAVSEIESDETRPSFTVDTLRHLRAGLSSGDDLWLLLGTDSVHDLPQWRDPDLILRLAGLGIYGRPGHETVVPPGARIMWIAGPACGLSSTLIRERVRENRPVRGLVPPEIESLLEASVHYKGMPRDG